MYTSLVENKFKEVNAQIEKIIDKFGVMIKFEDKDKENIVYSYTDTNKWKKSPDIVGDGVYKTVKEYGKDDGRSIITRLKKGYTLERHNHEDKEVIYCLKGIFKIDINNKKIILNKNESIFIDPYIYHSVEVLEDCELLVTWYKPEINF